MRKRRKNIEYPYPHKHVLLAHGAIASVSEDCTQETIDALNEMARIAYHMKIPEKTIKDI